jgi:hypothetical protein
MLTAGAAGMAVIVLALGGHAASGATITAVQIHGPVPTQQRGILDTVLLIGQILGILAAVVGLRFLAKQVKVANEATAAAVSQATAANHQNRHSQLSAKRQRTTTFQEQYTSHEFAVLTSRVDGYLDARDARDAVQKIQAWETAGHGTESSLPRTPRSTSAPKASKVDVVSVFGFYENMGAAYQLEQLDEEAFHRTFGPVPALDFARAWWFICWNRDGEFRSAGQPGDYSEFEDLVRKTLAQKPIYRDYCKPKASIRVIALPDSKVADEVAWDLCGRLSQALSSNADLQFDLGSTASGRTGEPSIVSKVIAIPNDLGLNACRWLKEVQAAEKLEKQLRQITRPNLEAALATVDA